MFGPFFWYPGPPPSGAFIRAMPVFRQPEHAKDVVRCCRNHTAEHSGKKKIYFSCFWGLAVVISEEFFSEYDAKAMQTLTSPRVRDEFKQITSSFLRGKKP